MSPLSRQRGLLKIHKTKVVSLHWSAVFSPDAVQLHGNRFTVSTRSGGFIGLSLFFRLAVRARLVLLAWLMIIYDLNFICSIPFCLTSDNRGGERSFCVIRD